MRSGLHLSPNRVFVIDNQPRDYGHLFDEPIANENIETIDELEKILSQRCCILNQMTPEIKHLTRACHQLKSARLSWRYNQSNEVKVPYLQEFKIICS